MSETKATTARRAKARERATEAESLDAMLGLGPVMTLGGRRLEVRPVCLAEKRRLDEALDRLGDDYVFAALAEDNPAGLTRVMRASNPEAAELTAGDIQTALRMATVGLTDEQISAMLDVCEMAFGGQATREELGRLVSARAFPAVLRALLDGSGLNP